MMRIWLMIGICLAWSVTQAASPLQLDDEIFLRDGSKIVCHVIAYEPPVYRVRTSVVNKFDETTIRVTQILSIKFGEPPVEEPVGEPKIQLGKRPPKTPVADIAAKLLDEDASDFGTIAFIRAGENAIDSNSQPFGVTEPALYIAGIKSFGESSFASITVSGIADSELIGGLASTQDFDQDGENSCVAKIDYDGGDGEGFANVNAQEGEWFVAVVNLNRIPNAEEIETLCRSMMTRFSWPENIPVHQ